MNLRNVFLKHVAQTSFSPLMLEIKHAEGLYLYDHQEKPYIDLIAGIGVSCLGHRHPAVLQAVKTQLDLYWHTLVYGEYILTPQVKLAKLLTDALPEGLDSVYFVNSGTEACEGAMKLAKRFTGRSEIISCKQAYHGSTQGSASLMWPTTFTQPYYPLLPGIKHIEFNCLPCINQISEKTAAVILETVQAEWGVRKPENSYLQELRKRCSETGTLLVLDEVQVGFGRTGTLFAFEAYGIVPDILLLAKGMGGGMPVGAFIASKDIMNSLASNPPLGHITTFGGHPVSCAASLAVLEVLQSTGLIQEVFEKEALFRKLLKHKAIVEVRSAGLLMAVELHNFDEVRKTIHSCLSKGLVTDWFLFNERCLRIAPPLNITMEEIQKACTIILEALDEIDL